MFQAYLLFVSLSHSKPSTAQQHTSPTYHWDQPHYSVRLCSFCAFSSTTHRQFTFSPFFLVLKDQTTSTVYRQTVKSSLGTAVWGKRQPSNPLNTPMVPEGSGFHSVSGLALPIIRAFSRLPCSIYWVPCTLMCTLRG